MSFFFKLYLKEQIEQVDFTSFIFSEIPRIYIFNCSKLNS